MIRFLAPWWLVAVGPVLAVAGVYAWRQWRRAACASRFTNSDLLPVLALRRMGRRRHLSAGAVLAALSALVNGAIAAAGIGVA